MSVAERYRPFRHIHWNQQCHATRRDGTRCRAWAIRGGYVCRMHGGATQRAQAAAAERIWTIAIGQPTPAQLRRGEAIMRELTGPIGPHS
jgi:hypothetical protein